MKKLATIVGAITLSCLAGAAQAQNWYVGGYGAMNYTHDGAANGSDNMNYDLGFGFGGMVGYAMPNGLRFEGELAYRSNGIDSIAGTSVNADITSWAVMGNILYEFQVQSNVKPHIGAGLGFAPTEVEIGNVSYSDSVVAGQLIAGIDYKMAPDMALILDYRLFFTEDLGLGAGIGLGGVEYTNSTFLVGLRKSF